MEEQTIARSPPPDTKQKQKKTYSQKREKARASVPKKFSLGFSLLVETDRGGCFRVFKDFVSYIYIFI